jgi:hypothetical protein
VEPELIVLIGTAHVSRRSQLDVLRVVRVGYKLAITQSENSSSDLASACLACCAAPLGASLGSGQTSCISCDLSPAGCTA